MKLMIASLLLTMIPGPAESGERYACNMNALTKTERAAHAKVLRALFEAVQETRELPNGYAFRLPAKALATAAEWVEYERRCCPFFEFELQVAKHEGPLWLRLTGAPDIKPFIRAELGI